MYCNLRIGDFLVKKCICILNQGSLCELRLIDEKEITLHSSLLFSKSSE